MSKYQEKNEDLLSQKMNSPIFVPYDKPISIWKTLSTSLNSAERDYVKFYLGQALIEQCDEIESEIESLLDIWRDYRNETVANCTDVSVRTLAEPPALRKRLTTEIEFFLKHIHEQCANNDQIFHRRLSAGHNWNAINYALVAGTGDDEKRIRERPVSARDRQGRETPILVIPEPVSNIDESKPTDLLSPRTNMNVDIELVRNKLQNFTIDDIIQYLRQAITDDIKVLEDHVTYLHQKLEEEADYRAKTRGLLKEPTLGELKEERNRLEKEVFNTTTNIKETVEQPSSPLQRQTSTITQSISRRSSTSSTNSSIQSPRSNGPLRAFVPESILTSKPRLAIDKKTSSLPNSKINAPVLVRLGTIKQQDLLKKYPTTNTAKASESTITRINSADKFRQMVLDCRETSS